MRLCLLVYLRVPRWDCLSTGRAPHGAASGDPSQCAPWAVQAGRGRGAGDDDRGDGGPCDLAARCDRGLPSVLPARDGPPTCHGRSLHTGGRSGDRRAADRGVLPQDVADLLGRRTWIGRQTLVVMTAACIRPRTDVSIGADRV